MKKTDESIKEELMKEQEVLYQELKGHSDSLSLFSALALAHSHLSFPQSFSGNLKNGFPIKTFGNDIHKKIDLKGDLQK